MTRAAALVGLPSERTTSDSRSPWAASIDRHIERVTFHKLTTSAPGPTSTIMGWSPSSAAKGVIVPGRISSDRSAPLPPALRTSAPRG